MEGGTGTDQPLLPVEAANVPSWLCRLREDDHLLPSLLTDNGPGRVSYAKPPPPSLRCCCMHLARLRYKQCSSNHLVSTRQTASPHASPSPAPALTRNESSSLNLAV